VYANWYAKEVIKDIGQSMGRHTNEFI